MNREEIQKQILLALKTIAPEVDINDLGMDEDLREQVDLDSMDYLNFLTKIAGSLEIQIPESDYPQLQSLESMLEYLVRKLVA